MFTTVINPTSRVVIAGRIAELRRRMDGHNDVMMLSDRELCDLPFSRARARAEVAKWFWQP